MAAILEFFLCVLSPPFVELFLYQVLKQYMHNVILYELFCIFFSIRWQPSWKWRPSWNFFLCFESALCWTIFIPSFKTIHAYCDFIWIILYFFQYSVAAILKMAAILKFLFCVLSPPYVELFLYQVSDQYLHIVILYELICIYFSIRRRPFWKWRPCWNFYFVTCLRLRLNYFSAKFRKNPLKRLGGEARTSSR